MFGMSGSYHFVSRYQPHTCDSGCKCNYSLWRGWKVYHKRMIKRHRYMNVSCEKGHEIQKHYYMTSILPAMREVDENSCFERIIDQSWGFHNGRFDDRSSTNSWVVNTPQGCVQNLWVCRTSGCREKTTHTKVLTKR